ncbi:MAG: radical SAM protein [Myxococcales bacterium]|nr:radical SAM protein [Myxococcales bacterium]
MNRPTYLRVVATTRCNHRCDFCHMEGDPHEAGTPSELPADALVACLRAAALAGVKKFKFLGGEPLLRNDLPQVIASLRGLAPDADISVITAGAVPVSRLVAAYEAGLTRVNMSIHGWSPEALAVNLKQRDGHARREAFLARACLEAAAREVPLKLNYVYSGAHQRDDLGGLLAWAATQPRVVVSVLDDLASLLRWRDIADVVTALRGPHCDEQLALDPDSLATLRRRWSDGLTVELKHQELGRVAPFDACADCDHRAACREGIMALRLTHRGTLQGCLHREDLGFALSDYVAANGASLGAVLLRNLVEAW